MILDTATSADRYLLTFEEAGHSIGLNPVPDAMRGRLWDQDWFEDPVWRKDRGRPRMHHPMQAIARPTGEFQSGRASSEITRPACSCRRAPRRQRPSRTRIEPRAAGRCAPCSTDPTEGPYPRTIRSGAPTDRSACPESQPVSSVTARRSPGHRCTCRPPACGRNARSGSPGRRSILPAHRGPHTAVP